MLWGEELEYIVVDTDKGQRTVKLSLRAEQVLSSLQQVENNDIKTKSGMINNRGTSDSSWKPEYARYMIEGTPGSPYGPTLRDLLLVEENMRQRLFVVN